MATRTLKKCKGCGESKPRTEFHKNQRAKDGLQYYCKPCINRKVYDSQKKEGSYAQRKVQRNREFLWKYLEEHPCEHCGLNDPRVMEFDHINQEDKTANISTLVYKVSIERLQEELAKCQVLCANCHKIRTAHQLNYWWTQLPD